MKKEGEVREEEREKESEKEEKKDRKRKKGRKIENRRTRSKLGTSIKNLPAPYLCGGGISSDEEKISSIT